MQHGAKFFIHATNVHQGGGATLLRGLLLARIPNLLVSAQLDARVELPPGLADNLKIRLVRPSVLQRLRAEWWLAKTMRPQDAVLCFGNLPPLFRTAGRVIVLLQNRYLIDAVSLKSFPLKTRLRLQAERWWFSWKSTNAHAFAVQTPSMRMALESTGRAQGKPIYVLPFVSLSDGYQRALDLSGYKAGTNGAFLYVASGEPHKNHRQLIEAWCLLAEQGLFPALWLTLDACVNTDLCTWIDKKKLQCGLSLKNLGVQPQEQIKHLYTQVQALIYPSTFESFGLPLIEARQAGLAVVASELDFVRDVLDPEEVFDPQSPVSIARAVKRFMGLDEKALPLLNAAEFLKNVLEKCE